MSLGLAVRRTLGGRTAMTKQQLEQEARDAQVMTPEEYASMGSMPSQGIYGQNFAATLNRGSADELFGGMSQGALSLYADREAQGLAAAAAATLRNNRAIELAKIKGDLAGKYITANPDKYMRMPTDQFGIESDPVVEAVGRNQVVQGEKSEAFKNFGAGAKDMYEAGIQPDRDWIGQALKISQGEPQQQLGEYSPDGFAPKELTSIQNNELDNATELQKAQIAANATIQAARERGQDGDFKVVFEQGADGRLIPKITVDGVDLSTVEKLSQPGAINVPQRERPLTAAGQQAATRMFGQTTSRSGAAYVGTVLLNNGSHIQNTYADGSKSAPLPVPQGIR